ncbi:MAG: dTDP-4-dehydrorhamnose reductase, partial [Prevotellaceae bacterium]|nr:dTDP-4-dehydrorhamnose reductase [Prevotellaceae bacterium]
MNNAQKGNSTNEGWKRRETILVTGSNGQLGNEMRLAAGRYPQFEYVFTDVAELDICNLEALSEFVQATDIHYIVNCAAYTAVDKAEEDVALCYKINRDAVGNLAQVAKKHNIKIVHVSTDYVFDGTNHLPYTEDMPTSPNTVYGKSKLEGEQLLAQTTDNYVVIRTAWLYSTFGNNFVKTMLKLGAERDTLNVIFDQIGSPTYAADLAEAIMQIIVAEKFTSGIYHFSNEGVCSWYDFTKAIHQLAGITCNV